MSRVYKIRINGVAVQVRFSGEESPDVKRRIRDILTESYHERFQEKLLEKKHLGQKIGT